VTKGLITQVIPPGTPFDMVLTNAVYFKGLWEHAFDKAATQTQAFHAADNSEVQVSYRPVTVAEALVLVLRHFKHAYA
jgi:serine protease inhibitor